MSTVDSLQRCHPVARPNGPQDPRPQASGDSIMAAWQLDFSGSMDPGRRDLIQSTFGLHVIGIQPRAAAQLTKREYDPPLLGPEKNHFRPATDRAAFADNEHVGRELSAHVTPAFNCWPEATAERSKAEAVGSQLQGNVRRCWNAHRWRPHVQGTTGALLPRS